MTHPSLDERYAALVADAERPGFAKIPSDTFEPDSRHDPVAREERIEDTTLGIRMALWRLVEWLNLEQVPADGEARAALVEDLATDASYLCFEFLARQPHVELDAELRRGAGRRAHEVTVVSAKKQRIRLGCAIIWRRLTPLSGDA